MSWEQLILSSHRLPNPPLAKSDDGERGSLAHSVKVCSSSPPPPPPLLLHSRFGAYVRLGNGEELPLRKVGRDFLNMLAAHSPRIPEVSSPSSTAVVTGRVAVAACDLSRSLRRVFNPLPSIRLLNESDEKADILATTEFSGPSSLDVGPRVDFYLVSRQLESLGHDARAFADPNKGMDMLSDEGDSDRSNRRNQEVALSRKLEKLDALVPHCCSVWVKISLSKKELKTSKSTQPDVRMPGEHDQPGVSASIGGRRPPKQTGTKRLRDGNASEVDNTCIQQKDTGGRTSPEEEVDGDGRDNRKSKKSQNNKKEQHKVKAKAKRKWGRMGWSAFCPSSDEETAEDEDDNAAATNEGSHKTTHDAEGANDSTLPPPREVKVNSGDCMVVGEGDKVVQNDRSFLLHRIVENIELVCEKYVKSEEKRRLSSTRDGEGLGGCSGRTVLFLVKMFEELSGLVLRQCSHDTTNFTSGDEGKRRVDENSPIVSLVSISYPPLLTIRAFAGGQNSYPILTRGLTCSSSRTRLGIDSKALISQKSPQLANHLRPYQLEAIDRALLIEGKWEERERRGARDSPIRLGGGTRRLGRILLADEMGLGKTLQAIGIVAALNELSSISAAPDNGGTDHMYSAIRSPFPVLVVCPASVRPMWAAEAERWLAPFFPAVSTCALSTNANPRERDEDPPPRSMEGCDEDGAPAQFVWSVTGHDSKLGVAATPPLVVISRQLVGTLYDIDLAHRNWGTIIVDESHQLHTTLASKEACRTTACVIRLCQSAPYTLMLSGTPSLSTPFDMYQQLVGLRPDLFAASPSGSPFVVAAGPPRKNEEFEGETCKPEVKERLSPLSSREGVFSEPSLPATTKEDFGFQFTEALVGHSGGGYLRFGKCQRLAELRSVLDCCFWMRREKKDVAMSSPTCTSQQLNVVENDNEDRDIGAIRSTPKPIGGVGSERVRDIVKQSTGEEDKNGTVSDAKHCSNADNTLPSALGPTVRRIVVCVRGNQSVFDEATQYLRAKSKHVRGENEVDGALTSASSSSGDSSGDDNDEKDSIEGIIDSLEHVGPPDDVASVTTTAAVAVPSSGALTPYHATGLAKVKALRPLLKMVIKNEIMSSRDGSSTGNMKGKPRLVLFAHHIDVLDVVQEMASRIVDGVDDRPSSSEILRRIDGSTPMPTRELILNQFQDSHQSVQILVAAVTACGVGVHQMAGASAAVFCELPPNISWLLQAEGRVARPRSQNNSSNNCNDVVGNSQSELCRVYVCVADNLRVDRRLWARLQRGFHDVATIMASSSPCGGGSVSQSEGGRTPSKGAKAASVSLNRREHAHDEFSDDGFNWVGETRGSMAFKQQLSFTLRRLERSGVVCVRLGFRLGQHTELVQIIAEINDAANQPSDPCFVLIASENKNACVELAVDAMKNLHDSEDGRGYNTSLYTIVVDGLRNFLVSLGVSSGGGLKTPPPSSGPFFSASFDASQAQTSTLSSSKILSSHEIRQRRLSGKVEWCLSLHSVSSHNAAAPKSCTSFNGTIFLPLDSDDNNSQSLSMLPFARTDPAPQMLKSSFSVSKPWDTSEFSVPHESTNERRELPTLARTSRPPRYANTSHLPPTVSDRAVVARWLPSSPAENAVDRARDCLHAGNGVADDVVEPLPLAPPPPQCVYVLLKVPVTVGGERLETKHLAIAERKVDGDRERLRLRCLQCRKGPALPLLQNIPVSSPSELRDTDSAAGVQEVLWVSVAPEVAAQFEIASSPYLYLFCSGACKASYFIVRSGTAIRRALGAHDKGICNHCQLDGDALLAELQSVSNSSSRFHESFSSGSVLTKAPRRKAKENSEVEARRKEIILMRQPEFAHHPVLLRRLACQPTAGNVWHADHRRPVRAGGGQAGLDNLQTLCIVCHAAKTRLEEKRYSARSK